MIDIKYLDKLEARFDYYVTFQTHLFSSQQMFYGPNIVGMMQIWKGLYPVVIDL